MWSTFTLNARSFKLYSQLLSWSNLQDSFIKLSFLRIIEIKLLLNWNKASGWFFLNHAEYFMLLVREISIQGKRMVPLVQQSTNCGQGCLNNTQNIWYWNSSQFYCWLTTAHPSFYINFPVLVIVQRVHLKASLLIFMSLFLFGLEETLFYCCI